MHIIVIFVSYVYGLCTFDFTIYDMLFSLFTLFPIENLHVLIILVNFKLIDP